MLAELTVYHSRPVAPTRRVALGDRLLPSTAGVLLLAGIVSHFARVLGPEDRDDVRELVEAVRDRRPVDQPQLRHRFQVDTVGLGRSRHRFFENDRWELADENGAPIQHVLAAIYAANLLEENRAHAFDAISVALEWHGPLDRSFSEMIERGVGALPLAHGDPVGWAQEILGLDPDDPYDDRSVRRRFRELVATVHPDTGGDTVSAAGRIRELAEAKRLLTDPLRSRR